MGYYSHYKLEVDSKEPDKIIEQFREQYEDAAYALDEQGYPEGTTKWYKHAEELAEFSKQYPDVLFTLHREGEESLDVEYTWAKNGKSYSDGIEIIEPEFDEKKLC